MILKPSRSTIEKEIAIRSAEYGVDCAIALAQCKAESSFNPSALNMASKCIGLFQLQAGTAADMGVDPYDWQGNIRGGMHYMQLMLKRFEGDYEKALAAYNWGPANLSRLLKKTSGNTRIWKRGLPIETQNYITKILKDHHE